MEILNLLAPPLVLHVSYSSKPYTIRSPEEKVYTINSKKVNYKEAQDFLSNVFSSSKGSIILEDENKDIYYRYYERVTKVDINYEKLVELAQKNPSYAKRISRQLDTRTLEKFTKDNDRINTFKKYLTNLIRIKDKISTTLDFSEEEKSRKLKTLEREEKSILSGLRKSQRKSNVLSTYIPKTSYRTKNWYTSVDKALTKITECDYSLFEKLWNDRENYGPIVSSCCYNGCLINKIPISSLMSTWVRIKNEVSSVGNFMDIYKYLIQEEKFDYTFCTATYNFLVDFYGQGFCNCECGSYLCMAMNVAFPDWNIPNVVLGYTEKHVSIMMPDQKLLIEKFETTKFGEIYLEKLENILYIIVSEQIVGISILFSSSVNRTDISLFTKVFERMFDVKLSENIVDILRKAKRPSIYNFLDSNSFDIILTKFFVYKRYQKYASAILKRVRDNNKKYIEKDLLQYVQGKEVTGKEIRERIIDHSEEIEQIVSEEIVLN